MRGREGLGAELSSRAAARAMNTSNSSETLAGISWGRPMASVKQSVMKERSPPESDRRSLTWVACGFLGSVRATLRVRVSLSRSTLTEPTQPRSPRS